MNVEVVIDGKTYEARVENGKVVMGGREYVVEDRGSSVEVDGTPYVVEVKGGEVTVNGIAHTVKVDSHTKPAEKKASAVAGAVSAVMPGRIVNVLVKEGDTVREADVVCILEAMKMENELRAPRSGTVKKVHVQMGANVDKGDVLVEIAYSVTVVQPMPQGSGP